jgi:anti-sigma factor RsiW
MTKCWEERRMDRYILGRLSEAEIREFEEHYFNCPACFAQLQAREAIVGEVIRKKDDLLSPDAATPSLGGRIRAAFAFRPWAAAAAAAGLLLVIAGGLLVLGRRPQAGPATVDESVRGATIVALEPAGSLKAAPAALAWKPAAPGREYQAGILGPDLSWTSPATETGVVLPEDVRARLRPGVPYVWQVKAYAPDGTLMERSPKTAFTISK